MKTKRGAIIELLRVREYIFLVLSTTLLGVVAADGSMGWRFFIVLAANFLATASAYVFNDIQDAAGDALNEAALTRNPIAAGHISTGLATSLLIGGLTASLLGFALLGWRVLLFGLLMLFVSWLYSARALQSSATSLLDLARHAWLLAGLQMLSAYYSFSAKGSPEFLILLVFIVSLSLYGELSNELRSQSQKRLRQQLLAIFSLGERSTHFLLIFLLAVAAFSGVLALFIYRILPAWLLLLTLALSTILIAPAFLKPDPQERHEAGHYPLHIPLEKALAVALVVYFVVPLILMLINP